MLKSSKKAIITFIILSANIIFFNGVTAFGYNPFMPDYYEDTLPGYGTGDYLSAGNADFVLTGKATGAGLKGNIDFADTKGHWAAEYIFRMAAQSVVRGYGLSRFSPEGGISRQEALAMLLRITGREEEVQRRIAAGGTPPAGSGILDLWAAEYIVLAQDTGIVGLGEGGNYQAAADREEVAVWFGRALGLNPVYGYEQQYIYNLKDWQSINASNQPLIEAILQEGIMKGDDRGYFNPRSGLKRSEMAVMLCSAADRFYNVRDLTAHSGQVIQKGTLNNIPAISIQNSDGTLGLITLNGGTDFPVFRNGITGLSADLMTGDVLDYVVDGEGVLYAVVPRNGAADTAAAPVKGYIRSVDPEGGSITITDYSGNVHTYSCLSNTSVTINSRPAGIKDLKFGLEVTLILKGDMVSAVDSSYYLEQPGYIPPPGRVRTGKVITAGSESLTISLDNGGREQFFVTSGTIITKGGKGVPAGSIRAGDRVRVFSDSVTSDAASRIEIEGMQQLIQDIYCGTLEAVHPSGNAIVLKDTSAFVNGDWEERERRVTFEISPGADIYYGGRAMTLSEVQYGYLDIVAYVAVDNNFGSRRAAKIVLKRGNEQLYGGSIYDISWGTGEMELRDGRSIMLNESSIILSHGRIMDISALDGDNTVTVIADRYNGINNAAVVMLEDAHIAGDAIYAGRLNEIRTGDFDMNYYSRLSENEWDNISSRSRDLTLEYDRDTHIVEITDSGTRIVSAADFFAGDYADEYSSKSRDDFYAYVITDGDRARAIRITEGSITKDGRSIENDDLRELRITTGEVKGIDAGLEILTVNKANNWSSFYERWERSDADNHINYAKALILRDGRVINAEELRQGESVYIIRDDNRGIIILVL